MRLLTWLFIIYCPLVLAGEEIPVFAYKWYTSIGWENAHVDACGRLHDHLEHLRPSAGGALFNLTMDLVLQGSCPGGVSTLLLEDTDEIVPPGHFEDVFPGSNDSYKFIKSNSYYPKARHAKLLCWGDKNYSKIEATIYPLYDCPDNAPYGFHLNHSGELEKGCYKNTHCEADVVGRDLDIPGLKWAGHVGMIFRGNNDPISQGNLGVLEVLNRDTKVIAINSLDNFYKASRYWGERYGVIKNQELTEEQAINIYFAGGKQIYFQPTYTMKSKYQEGRGVVLYDPTGDIRTMKPFTTTQPAIFRCDTFVSYSYENGANLKVPKGNNILPKLVYRSLENERNNVPDLHEQNEMLAKQKYLALEAQLGPICDESSIDKQELLLEDYLSHSEAGEYLWGDAIDCYLEHPQVSRERKLRFIFRALNSYSYDSPQATSLVAALEFEKPISYADQLIERYKKTTHPMTKEYIIRVLGESLMAKTPEQAKKLARQFQKQRKHIQQFFDDISLQEKNQRCFQTIIRQLVYVYSPQAAYQKLQLLKVARKDMFDNKHLNAVLHRKELDCILASESMEKEHFAGWLREFQQSPDPKILGYLALIAQGRDIPAFTNSSRDLLKQIFHKQWEVSLKNLHIEKKSTPSIQSYVLLQGYAAVSTKTLSEYNRFILEKIMAVDDPYEQAVLITHAEPAILKLLEPQDYKRLQQRLVNNVEASHQQNNLVAKQRYLSAMTVLRQKVVDNPR